MNYLALVLQQGLDSDQIQHIVLAMMAILPVIILVVLAIIIIPFWFICKKAGFSPWLSLLCIIPSIGMLVLIYVLAFAEWKVIPAPPQGWQQPPQPPYPPVPYSPPPPQG